MVGASARYSHLRITVETVTPPWAGAGGPQPGNAPAGAGLGYDSRRYTFLGAGYT